MTDDKRTKAALELGRLPLAEDGRGQGRVAQIAEALRMVADEARAEEQKRAWDAAIRLVADHETINKALWEKHGGSVRRAELDTLSRMIVLMKQEAAQERASIRAGGKAK